MGTIKLTSEDEGSNSILSNIFIDYYMPEANGTFVKVYLYLLRLQQGNRQISGFSEIADHLSCTDNDVERAIKYWIGKGLLQYRTDEKGDPAGIILCQPQSPDIDALTPRIVDFKLVRTEQPEPAPKKRKKAVQPSIAELEKALTDSHFLELKKEAEAFFRRPLDDKDINTLWYIYDDLHLPFDLCEYLLEYCAESKTDHPERIKPDYYKKIAENWAEEGIRTREEAAAASSRRFIGTKMLRALGIKDRYVPTDAEIRMIDEWRSRYGFSDEMLVLACEKALWRDPKSPGFPLVKGILESWYSQGLRTPQDVARSDTKKRRPSGKTQNEFMQSDMSDDLALIERMSLEQVKES